MTLAIRLRLEQADKLISAIERLTAAGYSVTFERAPHTGAGMVTVRRTGSRDPGETTVRRELRDAGAHAVQPLLLELMRGRAVP